MLEIIQSVNTTLNNFIWGVPAMVCIIGVGLFLAFRTKCIQIRKFPHAMRTTVGRIFKKVDASHGAITPFQAVCTALAATVGTGNIAGVAGAIALGGPGAVFWMWISALLGMGTKFAEVTLAVHFRERNNKGDYVGGPMYYIKNGLGKKWMWLAGLYAFFGVCAVFGTGNATQVNTITAAIDTALMNYGLLSADAVGTCNLIIGIVICIIVGLVLLGGVKRIGEVSERLVPVMALLYILFFGLYPMLKGKIEQLRRLPVELAVKLLVCNLILTVILLFFGTVFFRAVPLGQYSRLVLYLICNVAFFAYDYGFSKVIGFYIQRVDRVVRKG